MTRRCRAVGLLVEHQVQVLAAHYEQFEPAALERTERRAEAEEAWRASLAQHDEKRAALDATTRGGVLEDLIADTARALEGLGKRAIGPPKRRAVLGTRLRSVLRLRERSRISRRGCLWSTQNSRRCSPARRWRRICSLRAKRRSLGPRCSATKTRSSSDARRFGELSAVLGDARASSLDVERAQAELEALREAREAEAVRHAEDRLKLEAALGAEERRVELDRERLRLSSVATTYAFLADHLKSDHFQDYVLEESFAKMTAGASERLMKLSDRYTLLPKAPCGFEVVDHDNARQTRGAETLSGGETFLTSLALAMELSAEIQRSSGGPPLDSIFIDEGFGTLDPESLDVVADAIEALPKEGKMVGIVTHVGALAQRMPVRIEVEKSAEGSRVRRVGG